MTSSTAVSPCHFPKAAMSHTHPVPHPKKLKGAKGKRWGNSPHKSSPGACAGEPTWLLPAHDPQVRVSLDTPRKSDQWGLSDI